MSIDRVKSRCRTSIGRIRWRLRVRAEARELQRYDAEHAVQTFPPDERKEMLRTGGCDVADVADLRSALGLLDEDPLDVTFVDLGYGRGKALLSAVDIGYRKLAGIEIDADLAAAAKRNFRSYRPALPVDVEVDLKVGDAGEYDFPPGPLVVHMYNPFDADVVEAALGQLIASRSPESDVWVVYLNPRCAEVFDRFPAFRLAHDCVLHANRPGTEGRLRIYQLI